MNTENIPAAIPVGSRTSSRIAWSLCVLTVALIVCAGVLSIPNRYGYGPWELLFLVAEAMGALVGGLIASRQPTNPVGWFISGHVLCFSPTGASSRAAGAPSHGSPFSSSRSCLASPR